MVKLRYTAGRVISPEVHQVGILALGSHLENHGPALPIDTDAKIAAYLALESALSSGAKFLGILYAATEYKFVKHGIHLEVEELVYNRLKPTLRAARDNLNLKYVVLVNAHGGNLPICDYLPKLEAELGLKIIFNNYIVEKEGPHAGTGELSMGAVLGIIDKTKIQDQCQFDKYPEVGMVGLQEARKESSGINKGALLVENEGVCVDLELGYELLDDTIENILIDIENILKN